MLLGIGDESCYSLFAGLQGRTHVGELSKLDFLFNLENTLSACSFVDVARPNQIQPLSGAWKSMMA
jgi:hypothetical protein